MRNALIIVAVVAAFFASWYFSIMRRLTRDYARTEPFDGTLVRSRVRFALAEYPADCALGANREGLYISSSPEAVKKGRWWWSSRYQVKTPFLIPWDRLHFAESALPLRGYIRVDVSTVKTGFSSTCFFIPQEIARPLLTAAGRQISPR
jgi:hypothetical protein